MILIIDNYDSFTYNLLHYMGELGAKLEVVRNDAVSVEEVASNTAIKGIVISPGPCDPDKAGICLDLIEKMKDQCPILGVCLGHQAIGQVLGAKVVRAAEPVHGKVFPISHSNQSVFKDLPEQFSVTRYHSLILERASLPKDIEIIAQTEDGTIMGITHNHYPLHGVQFHPESIASEYGHDLLKNFLQLVDQYC